MSSELIAGFGKLACSKQHLIVCQSDPPCPCHRVNLYRNPSAQANIAFKTTVDVWCEDDSVNKSHQNLKSDESSPLMAFIGVRVENSDNYTAASVHCLTEGHFKMGQSKVSHLLSDGEKSGRKSWKLENGLTFTDLAYDDRTDPSELKAGDEVNYYRFSAKDELLESHYERKIHRKDCVAWVRKVVDKSADFDGFGEYEDDPYENNNEKGENNNSGGSSSGQNGVLNGDSSNSKNGHHKGENSNDQNGHHKGGNSNGENGHHKGGISNSKNGHHKGGNSNAEIGHQKGGKTNGQNGRHKGDKNSHPTPQKAETETIQIKKKIPPMPKVDPTGKYAYDMIFVLDESGSIGPVDFEKEKEFLAIFVKKFGVTPGFSKTAVVKFSHTATVEWDFGGFPTQDTSSVLEKISKIPYQSGGTNIDLGLKTAKSILSKYRRKDVIQAVLLLTDGHDMGHYVDLKNGMGPQLLQSFNPAAELSPSCATAEQMRKTGVQMFVIGIGKEILPMQLNAIASGEVFRTDIQDLPSIADQVVKKIRDHGTGIKQKNKSKSNNKK